MVALLVKAAELHVRADLGVVDAAERDLTPGALDSPHRPRRHPRYAIRSGVVTGAADDPCPQVRDWCPSPASRAWTMACARSATCSLVKMFDT